jgi:6,7-dimethyl-8-ribityllumazine synthase
MTRMETAERFPITPAPGARVLIVAARYYAGVVDAMIASARSTLEAAGATIEVAAIPGAFEAPGAIAMAAGAYDGFIALGCVVRGETSHYDYVCGESARGLMDLSIRQGLAIGYGILTVENLAQAEARADPARQDKGAEAARACLAMIAWRRRMGGT